MSGDVAEAADYLKFAAARAGVVRIQFQALMHDSGAPAAPDTLALLGHMHTELAEAAARLCPEGQDAEVWSASYSDGRPVISAMPIDGGGPGIYVHVWHPDPTHPMNSRCELEVITTPKGSRKQILVTAPGVIDAVTVPDGQPVCGNTG